MNNNFIDDNARGPCDDYCPYVSSVVCGLPDGRDVRVAAESGLVWACHSNETMPCVATNHVKFPSDCTRITTPEEFRTLTGFIC